MVAGAEADVAVVAEAVEIEPMPIPHHFQVQWHITERCNLRCGHCYQNSFERADPPLDVLRSILQQIVEAVDIFSRERQRKIPARITLTGGEPFLHSDFFELLDAVAKLRRFRWAILTNGTLIDRQMVLRLKRYKPDYVQVSLDGTKQTHETLRGQGSFEPAVEGIRQLVRAGSRTIISFTASRLNVADFPAVAQLGAELGVQRVWADRLIPNSHEQQGLSLSPEETRSFFETMRELRQSLRESLWGSFLRRASRMLLGTHGCTEVAMNRALQFLIGGGEIYRCPAGRSLVAVLPDGTLVPCRRLPIPVGNLLDTPLIELYRSSELFRQLRNPRLPESSRCSSCPFSEGCNGGLRCLAHSLTGSPFSGDPGCWIVEQR